MQQVWRFAWGACHETNPNQRAKLHGTRGALYSASRRGAGTHTLTGADVKHITDTPVGYSLSVRYCRTDAQGRTIYNRPIQRAASVWIKSLPTRRFKTRAPADAALHSAPAELREWLEVGELYALGAFTVPAR
jgi:hypothetical protein